MLSSIIFSCFCCQWPDHQLIHRIQTDAALTISMSPLFANLNPSPREFFHDSKCGNQFQRMLRKFLTTVASFLHQRSPPKFHDVINRYNYQYPKLSDGNKWFLQKPTIHNSQHIPRFKFSAELQWTEELVCIQWSTYCAATVGYYLHAHLTVSKLREPIYNL